FAQALQLQANALEAIYVDGIETSFFEAIHSIDHVYVVTSTLGLVALVAGVSVTTLGSPFYASWGLTDDRQSLPRRNKVLNLDQLLYICCETYPKYVDMLYKQQRSFAEILTE
ncbi:MAG: hypothetical protein VXY56_07455, partial [Pseudomonadota bacterium]|nr:hypothetical protein [Pseudomonadota bacterium]